MKKLNVLPDNPQPEEAEKVVKAGRFPPWLHRRLPAGNALWETQKIVQANRLPTVCEEARCPNLLECWSKKTATFLAMGKACTRNCGFCDIDFDRQPKTLEPDEPHRLALSVQQLELKHVVITMVARDDLPDGGALHLTKIIQEVRRVNPEVTIEVLTSDFGGNREAIQMVLESRPDIYNHNLETVKSLTPRVRHKATYDRSLALLQQCSQFNPTLRVKSGLMVGLGERVEEIKESLRDLKAVGCQIVTIGQYLQPNRHKLLVKSFVTPEQFAQYAAYGKEIGIPYMYCGPFVRSSYNAAEVFNNTTI